MLHTWSLENLNLEGVWLSIGSFDGVHIGHQAILSKIIHGAHAQRKAAVALNFYPHPAVVLGRRSGAFYLSTPEGKADFLNSFGLDVLVTHPFNAAVALLSARDFVERLHRHLGFQVLCVGSDFALGHNREGDLKRLRQLGEEFGFQVQPIEPVTLDGRIVSSSWVRSALADGDMETVKRLLGRPFELSGEVTHGDSRGKSLGFPTANLEVWEALNLPKPGVYTGWAEINGLKIPAVTNVGYRPTFENQSALPRVEAHLLDFDEDIYHRRISLSFVHCLREERRFENVAALIDQIEKDIQNARKLLEVRSHATVSGLASTHP